MKHRSYPGSFGLVLSTRTWPGSEEVPITVAKVMWEDGRIYEEIFQVLELVSGVNEIS